MGTDNDGMFNVDEGADISAAIHQALGYASVCWDGPGPLGVFQSEKAHDAALKLEAYLFPAAHAPRGHEPVGPEAEPFLRSVFGDATVDKYKARNSLGILPGDTVSESDTNRITGSINSIDDAPEFWHGLTHWGAATDVSSTRTVGSAIQMRDGHGVISLDSHEYEIAADELRKWRDLLNVATARGAL